MVAEGLFAIERLKLSGNTVQVNQSSVAEGLFAIERLKPPDDALSHLAPSKVAEGLFAIERLKHCHS